MMKVRISYLTQARRAAGLADEEIELPRGTTLAGLLRSLAERHPEAGLLHPSLLLFRGDEQTWPDDPAPLRDAEHVTILAPMAGG